MENMRNAFIFYFNFRHFIVWLCAGTQNDKYTALFPILSGRLNILMGSKGRNKHVSEH